jgi:hypothetical protein
MISQYTETKEDIIYQRKSRGYGGKTLRGMLTTAMTPQPPATPSAQKAAHWRDFDVWRSELGNAPMNQ